jgi:hypothetical protein
MGVHLEQIHIIPKAIPILKKLFCALVAFKGKFNQFHAPKKQPDFV